MGQKDTNLQKSRKYLICVPFFTLGYLLKISCFYNDVILSA